MSSHSQNAHKLVSWEEAVLWFRSHPDKRQLVEAAGGVRIPLRGRLLATRYCQRGLLRLEEEAGISRHIERHLHQLFSRYNSGEIVHRIGRHRNGISGD